MLRFSIVILHALTVLAQGSIPEYFYEDEGVKRSDMETAFRYDAVEDPKESGTPVAYLYVAKDSSPPAKKQCITCLYELYNTGGDLGDACDCLPCWVPTSKYDATQKFIIGVFEKRSCGAVRNRNRADWNKEMPDEEIDSPLRQKQRKKSKTESEKNVKNVKYFEDYLHYPDESEHPVKRKKTSGQTITLKSSLTSDDSSTCVGEDCRDEETIKAVHDESDKVVKEKVKKVFNDVLSKMIRINKADEEAEKTETSKDDAEVSAKEVSMNRRQKNQGSEERPKWQEKKRYDNQYRRPSFRVALAPRRDSSNHRKSEKSDDIISDEDDMGIMPIGARLEEMTESKISKSSESKDRKSKIGKEERSDDVSEGIPDDISIGSLTFTDPFGDEEEVDYDDQLSDDGFTSFKDLNSGSSEADIRDYTIHYDDDFSEEKNQKNGTDKRTTEAYQETRNTPGDDDRSKTTETPYRSGKLTTPRGLGMSKSGLKLSKLGKTTEERISKVLSEEKESVTSRDEGGYSTESNNRRNLGQKEAIATTEPSRSEQTQMTSDNSTMETVAMSEESTTASSKALVMRFKDVSRSTEGSRTSEESTESTVSLESPKTDPTPYDSSTESASKTTSSESSEITFQFRSTRKYTRSISQKGTTNKQRRGKDGEEKTEEVTESTKSERFLRQTDSSDLKLEMNEKSKTTEPVDVANRRMGDDNKNATQDKNPRYVIELEDESDSSGKTWNPDVPILKVKVNIFSNSEPGNVYNFLSKLIPKDRNSSDRESRKGLQIETSFQNDRPKTLSVKNVEKPNRRGY